MNIYLTMTTFGHISKHKSRKNVGHFAFYIFFFLLKKRAWKWLNHSKWDLLYSRIDLVQVYFTTSCPKCYELSIRLSLNFDSFFLRRL